MVEARDNLAKAGGVDGTTTNNLTFRGDNLVTDDERKATILTFLTNTNITTHCRRGAAATTLTLESRAVRRSGTTLAGREESTRARRSEHDKKIHHHLPTVDVLVPMQYWLQVQRKLSSQGREGCQEHAQLVHLGAEERST